MYGIARERGTLTCISDRCACQNLHHNDSKAKKELENNNNRYFEVSLIEWFSEKKIQICLDLSQTTQSRTTAKNDQSAAAADTARVALQQGDNHRLEQQLQLLVQSKQAQEDTYPSIQHDMVCSKA